MKTLLSIRIVLSLTVLALLVVEMPCNPLSSETSVHISYEELQKLGTSCYPADFCQGKDSFTANCDCDSSCSAYDTCCLNSEFRIHTHKSKNNQKCLPIYSSYGLEIFMVDSCKNDQTSDNLCFSDPEENNDPFLMIPVTSNVSGITYKNYFCAVCNEEIDSEQLHLWDINVVGHDKLLKNLSEPHFKYNKTINSWTVFEDISGTSPTFVPVTISTHQSLNVTVKYCSSDLVENCTSNWTDKSVEEKCRAYMAKVSVFRNETRITYRNPHCALCNFEDLEKVRCSEFSFDSPVVGYGRPGSAVPSSGSVPPTSPLVGIFLLEDRQRRCGRNMIYDKLADKCRCNSRIYSKVNGKCVHKI